MQHRQQTVQVSAVRLVCFGSESCLLVPKSSSTPVAAWAWPTWVVSRRRVGSCVCLVGVSTSFEKNFYQLPFTPPPPLWFAVSVLQSRLCCACFGLANLFVFVVFTRESRFSRFFRGSLWLSPATSFHQKDPTSGEARGTLT
jgi:hypothetical protein